MIVNLVQCHLESETHHRFCSGDNGGSRLLYTALNYMARKDDIMVNYHHQHCDHHRK